MPQQPPITLSRGNRSRSWTYAAASSAGLPASILLLVEPYGCAATRLRGRRERVRPICPRAPDESDRVGTIDHEVAGVAVALAIGPVDRVAERLPWRATGRQSPRKEIAMGISRVRAARTTPIASSA